MHQITPADRSPRKAAHCRHFAAARRAELPRRTRCNWTDSTYTKVLGTATAPHCMPLGRYRVHSSTVRMLLRFDHHRGLAGTQQLWTASRMQSNRQPVSPTRGRSMRVANELSCACTIGTAGTTTTAGHSPAAGRRQQQHVSPHTYIHAYIHMILGGPGLWVRSDAAASGGDVLHARPCGWPRLLCRFLGSRQGKEG